MQNQAGRRRLNQTIDKKRWNVIKYFARKRESDRTCETVFDSKSKAESESCSASHSTSFRAVNGGAGKRQRKAEITIIYF